MLNHPISILVLEDDPEDIDLLKAYLAKTKNFQATFESVESLAEGLEYLSQHKVDVVLCDLSLPDAQGIDTFCTLYAQFPQLAIIILSGLDDEELAVQALAEGAQDYLIKGGFNRHLLTRTILFALERQQLRLKQEKFSQLLEEQVNKRTAELNHAVQQLREKDAQLREALAQEKELSELKSRIISTISHEYRTPLTTILSSAELLETYRHKWDNEKQNKYFQKIQNAVYHLTDIVDDVLFINKAEFEKLEFQPNFLDLVDLCRGLVEELQATINHQHHLIFIHQGEAKPFWGDSKRLRHLFTNLISNAIKYSPQGGTIKVNYIGEKTRVIIQISDEGIGIPLEDRDKLFKSFSRASNVSTIAGTGLGLSIAKKCVELHQGEITFTSTVGVGTTFTLSLPNNPTEHELSSVMSHHCFSVAQAETLPTLNSEFPQA